MQTFFVKTTAVKNWKCKNRILCCLLLAKEEHKSHWKKFKKISKKWKRNLKWLLSSRCLPASGWFLITLLRRDLVLFSQLYFSDSQSMKINLTLVPSPDVSAFQFLYAFLMGNDYFTSPTTYPVEGYRRKNRTQWNIQQTEFHRSRKSKS